jgi:hypothetical protein
MQFFTFTLPVKKYIQKYLAASYGPTVYANMDTDIGFFVLNALGSSIDGKISRGYINMHETDYNGSITITIPYHYFYLTKKEIHKYTCLLINRYLETKFEEDLCRYVENVYQAGVARKTAIIMLAEKAGYSKKKALERYANLREYARENAVETFVNRFGIDLEVDITSEALKKMEWRYRKKKSENSLRILSSFSPLFESKAS